MRQSLVQRAGLSVRLDDPSWIEELDRQLHRLRPAMVVLDPLSFLHEGEENSNSDMARVMKQLVRLAHAHKTLVLVIHHVSKPGDRGHGRATDRLRGASSLGGATDANLILQRRRGTSASLLGEFRDFETVELGLDFDPESLTLEPTESVPRRRARKVTAHDAAALVQSSAERLSAGEAAKRLGVSRNTAKPALLEAARLGLIEHEFVPGRGNQFWPLDDDLAA